MSYAGLSVNKGKPLMWTGAVVAFSGALILLAACAGTPTYAPATEPGGIGYSETAIESDRYRVTYRGGDQALARDYALLRAADLTLAKGYDWFRVTNSSVEEDYAAGGPRVSVGGSTGTWGRHSTSGVGVGIGIPIGGTGPAVQTFEIVLGSGDKPADPDVYDARSVSQSVRARLGASPS